MKNCMMLLLLLAFAAFASPVKAQEMDSIQLLHEIDGLEGIIVEKDHRIDSLNEELDSKDIKLRSDSLDREFMVLKKEHDSLKNARMNLLVRCKELRETINEYDSQNDAFTAQNAELEGYKNHVAPLVKRQLSQMATTVDQTWLNKTYDATDKDELQKEVKLYEAFKDQDNGVAEAYLRLNVFYNDLLLYQQGVEIINSPYVAEKVANILPLFTELANNEQNPGRKTETELVLDQLKDYKFTVRYFQEDIIGEIDTILKEEKNKKKAKEKIKNFLDTGDDGMIEQYLTKIPWLGEQYHQYIKQLESDPYETNLVRKVIMEIKP